MIPTPKNEREAQANRERLRRELSALLKRELTEAEAIDYATRAIKVFEQVEREKRK